jgi:three prime repair exonuclease-2
MDPVEEQKCARNEIRSFIILDLETTGLPNDKPVKITEISMVAALREHIIGHGNYITKGVALPRVLSKVTVCVDPRKRISQTASDITRTLNMRLYFSVATDVRLGYFLE